jgi:predicted alpha/beta-fold hydrolase
MKSAHTSKAQGTAMGDGRPFPSDFEPRRGLAGGHRQTLAGNFFPRENRLPKPEDRMFTVEEGVQILCHCHWQPDRRTRTTLIVVHGLEGSSESQYVIGTANKAWARDMNVVRMNMRNCGGTEEYTPTLYNSGMSADVGGVVKTLIAEDALTSLAIAGFSMGGNLVLKLAGEWGEEFPPEVKAVCAISPAIDLGVSAAALHEWQNRVYEYRFLHGLHARMARKAKLFPERYKSYPLFSIRTLRDFDDRITAHYGGFNGAEDYYYRAAAARVVDKIAAPTLIIHALDDPFIRLTGETRSRVLANPHIRYIETEHGGHCAFLAGPVGYDGRWAEKKIVEFATEFAFSSATPVR